MTDKTKELCLRVIRCVCFVNAVLGIMFLACLPLAYFFFSGEGVDFWAKAVDLFLALIFLHGMEKIVARGWEERPVEEDKHDEL